MPHRTEKHFTETADDPPRPGAGCLTSQSSGFALPWTTSATSPAPTRMGADTRIRRGLEAFGACGSRTLRRRHGSSLLPGRDVLGGVDYVGRRGGVGRGVRRRVVRRARVGGGGPASIGGPSSGLTSSCLAHRPDAEPADAEIGPGAGGHGTTHFGWAVLCQVKLPAGSVAARGGTAGRDPRQAESEKCEGRSGEHRETLQQDTAANIARNSRIAFDRSRANYSKVHGRGVEPLCLSAVEPKSGIGRSGSVEDRPSSRIDSCEANIDERVIAPGAVETLRETEVAATALGYLEAGRIDLAKEILRRYLGSR
jgi:hypothetical protein